MKHLLTLFLILTALAGKAQQDCNGYWYGSGNIENGGSVNNYMFELLVEQKGSSATGILNYYFKNTFRSFKLGGSFNSMTRTLSLFNVPVTYYGSPASMEVDCPMDFVAQLRVSRVESELKGNLVSKGSYKNTCPPVYFSLKKNTDAGNRDSILQAIALFKETKQYWTPGAYDTLVAVNVIQRPVVNYVVNNEFLKRTREVAQEIEVEGDSVELNFYDNGEIDGDSISVFFNGQLLTYNRLLSTKAIRFELKLDTSKAINEVGMFANNLGRIAPNTALMTVWDGKKRYEIRLSSSLEKNAIVRLRRKKRK